MLSKKGIFFGHHEGWWFESCFSNDCSIVKVLQKMWLPTVPQRILEVGCGSGRFLTWLHERGHIVAGVEASKELVEKARERLPEGVVVWHNRYEELSFRDRSFDVVFFVFSLEFMDNPMKALAEAWRVSKHSMIIVALSKYSLSVWYEKWKSWIEESPLFQAKLYSIREIKRMVLACTGMPIRIKCKWTGSIFLSPAVVIKFDKSQLSYRLSKFKNISEKSFVTSICFDSSHSFYLEGITSIEAEKSDNRGTYIEGGGIPGNMLFPQLMSYGPTSGKFNRLPYNRCLRETLCLHPWQSIAGES